MSGPRALFAIACVETLRLLRSPTSLSLLLIVPAMQLLLFGYAIRPDAATLRLAIAGSDRGQAALVDLARQSGLSVVARNLPPGAAAAMVRRGEVEAAAELPSEPGKPLRIVIDGSDPALTAGLDQRVRAIYWRGVAERAEVDGFAPPLAIERLYNAKARADWGFLPALIGTILMIAMLMLGTLGMARERELGTWEALAAMPVGGGTLLAGKVAPLVLIGTVQGGIVLGLGHALFDLPVRGSVAALIVLFPIFAAAHLVLGHALAARARTQMAALQGAVAFYLPAMLLSGFLYPVAGMPVWAQALGQAFPLTHFIRAARAATLRGGDAVAVLQAGAPIALFLAVVTPLALMLQRARVD